MKDLGYRKKIAQSQLVFFKDPDNIAKELIPYKRMIHQNLIGNYSVVCVNSDIRFFFSGREALDAMYEDICNATEHIHLQSYVFDDDTIGTKFKDILVEKARKGVEVRVMYDGAGTLGVKKSFFREMRDAGVETLEFSPIRFLMPNSKVNYRNHRKLLVVDGKVGYLGGVNIADRYYDGGSYKEWRDTQIRVVGQSVYTLQTVFLFDRFFLINRHLKRRRKYFPDIESLEFAKNIPENSYFTQTVSSGPDSDWASIMQCYFTAISSSKDHIYINTPYFTPSESLLNALKIAALGGVNVSIMLPEKSDSRIIHYCTMSYISDLLKAGINVYLFKNGFNHSKSISIDGEYCIIGSANMDNRSMNNDFEITSIWYSPKCAAVMESRFEKDLNRCSKLSISKWKNRPAIQKVWESIARLVSPLM